MTTIAAANANMDEGSEKAGKRRLRSKAERRQIVEETLRPGASVAVIARQHGVNANQVFHWRKQYREGLLDVRPSAPELLPVRLSAVITEDQPKHEVRMASVRSGAIQIELGNARVRIEGAPDLDCVRTAIESLRR